MTASIKENMSVRLLAIFIAGFVLLLGGLIALGLRTEQKTRLTWSVAQDLRECLKHYEQFACLKVVPSTLNVIEIQGSVKNTNQIEALRILINEKKPMVRVWARLYVGEQPPANFGKEVTFRIEAYTQ